VGADGGTPYFDPHRNPLLPKKAAPHRYVRGKKKRRTGQMDIMALRAMFNRVDRKRMGYITLKELGRALADIEQHPGSVQLRKIFEAADTDGDAKIDCEEFVGLIRNNQAILGGL
jgi:Ca2+-binding EF-hand superfamily protein